MKGGIGVAMEYRLYKDLFFPRMQRQLFFISDWKWFVACTERTSQTRLEISAIEIM